MVFTTPTPPPNRQKYTCLLLVHSGVLVFLRVRKQSITAILHVRMSVLSVLPYLKEWAVLFTFKNVLDRLRIYLYFVAISTNLTYHRKLLECFWTYWTPYFSGYLYKYTPPLSPLPLRCSLYSSNKIFWYYVIFCFSFYIFLLLLLFLYTALYIFKDILLFLDSIFAVFKYH